MADLGSYNNKLLDEDQQQEQNANQTTNVDYTPAGTSGVVGSGSDQVSTAGIGPGGTGNWTNIQAYLNANQGDNGSAKNLEEKADKTYDSEVSNLNTQAGQAKDQAQGAANKISDAKNNAKTWVNQAANAYDWGGNNGQDYGDYTGKLKNALYNQYSGPTSFSYASNGDMDRMKSAFADDNAFNNYMNEIYREKAGGQLNQGQAALQTQLDVNNQNLSNARANILNKYAGLDDLVNQKVTDTNADIETARKLYGVNQNALASYLGTLGTDYQGQIGNLENQARDLYNVDYNSGSGLRSARQSRYYRPDGDWTGGGTNATGKITAPDQKAPVPFDPEDYTTGGTKYSFTKGNQDLANETWKQIADDKALGGLDGYIVNTNTGKAATPIVSEMVNEAMNNQYNNNQALQRFYDEQDQKYYNTADLEKRNWNTIMDILNNTGNKKQQGFAVRG